MVTVEDDMMMYTTDYLLIMIHLKNKTNNESYELLYLKNGTSLLQFIKILLLPTID